MKFHLNAPIAAVRVSPELVASSLSLPFGADIVGVEWDEDRRLINLLVSHYDLPMVEAGNEAPLAMVRFEVRRGTFEMDEQRTVLQQGEKT